MKENPVGARHARKGVMNWRLSFSSGVEESYNDIEKDPSTSLGMTESCKLKFSELK